MTLFKHAKMTVHCKWNNGNRNIKLSFNSAFEKIVRPSWKMMTTRTSEWCCYDLHKEVDYIEGKLCCVDLTLSFKSYRIQAEIALDAVDDQQKYATQCSTHSTVRAEITFVTVGSTIDLIHSFHQSQTLHQIASEKEEEDQHWTSCHPHRNMGINLSHQPPSVASISTQVSVVGITVGDLLWAQVPLIMLPKKH